MPLLPQLWQITKKSLLALQKSALRTWMTMLPKQHITWRTLFSLTPTIPAIAFPRLLHRHTKPLRRLLLWEAAKLLAVVPIFSVAQMEPRLVVSALICTKVISRGQITTMKLRRLVLMTMCHSLNWISRPTKKRLLKSTVRLLRSKR